MLDNYATADWLAGSVTVCGYRLPDSMKSTDHVTEVFIDRLGFTQQETVALMGAHSIGRMQMNNSGYEGIWDQTFSKLDSRYYTAILSFPWCRYFVDETGFTYEHEENPKHEWRVPAEMSEAADYYDTSTPKLLNTDMCLAWAIGDGDDVNEQTCPTKCMSGDIWDECTNPVEEGATTNGCAESSTSPDSPSGKVCVVWLNVACSSAVCAADCVRQADEWNARVCGDICS